MIEPRRFAPLLAAVGAVILVHQLADLALLLPAADFATPSGRVRQVLALEARSPGVLTADVLLLWALLGGGYRGALGTLANLHLGLGALLLLLLPWFLLDAGRLAGDFAGPESLAFRIVVARTLLLLLLLGVGALLVGRALRSRSRETRTAAKSAA